MTLGTLLLEIWVGLVVILALPLAYRWAFRGKGRPLPRTIERRHATRPAAAPDVPRPHREPSPRRGTLIGVGALIAVLSTCAAIGHHCIRYTCPSLEGAVYTVSGHVYHWSG